MKDKFVCGLFFKKETSGGQYVVVAVITGYAVLFGQDAKYSNQLIEHNKAKERIHRSKD